MIKVKHIIGDSGRPILNQFIVEYSPEMILFQSYSSIICLKINSAVYINGDYYKYSRTTMKYLSRFLGESIKEIDKKIKSKEYNYVTDKSLTALLGLDI